MLDTTAASRELLLAGTVGGPIHVRRLLNGATAWAIKESTGKQQELGWPVSFCAAGCNAPGSRGTGERNSRPFYSLKPEMGRIQGCESVCMHACAGVRGSQEDDINSTM